MFRVQLAEGEIVRCHKDHVRYRAESETTPSIHSSLATSTVSVTCEVPSSETLTDESPHIKKSQI